MKSYFIFIFCVYVDFFYDKMNDLEDTLRDVERTLIVAGDFNAKANWNV